MLSAIFLAVKSKTFLLKKIDIYFITIALRTLTLDFISVQKKIAHMRCYESGYRTEQM